MRITKSATSLEDAKGLAKSDIYPFPSLYDKRLLNEHERRQETKSRQGHLHPSSIGYCARKNVYGASGASIKPGVLKVQDLEIFKIGHLMHDRIQSVLADLQDECEEGIKWSFASEVPMGEDNPLWEMFRLKGTCDGIITALDTVTGHSQRMVLEIKTMGMKGFEELRSPKPIHLIQGNIYAYVFDAPIIWYWYYCKNDSRKKCFAVPFDENLWETQLERIYALSVHVANSTLPDREESWYMCPRCEYEHVCRPSCTQKTRVSSRRSLGRR